MPLESIKLFANVTPDTFDESGYLEGNPDVRRALEEGAFKSGREHFEKHGLRENRQQRVESIPPAWREEKLGFLKSILLPEIPFRVESGIVHCVDAADLEALGAEKPGPVSRWGYDEKVRGILSAHAKGWILDCGAGRRSTYYRNVVNLELFPFESTDILARNDRLPFCDASFDAVISSAVLEHVQDPFQCAREITRVLKPGGTLFCAVPFLQPYHGYPHHYYNMTADGLRNLFAESITVEEQSVYGSLHPISSLCWMVQSWARHLSDRNRDAFERVTVAELLKGRNALMREPWVEELPESGRFELAAGTVLIGKRK